MPLNRTTFIIAIVVAVVAGALIGIMATSYLNRGPTGGQISAVAPAAPATAAPPPSRPAATMNGKASLTMQEAADRLSLRLMTEGGSADDWALLARSFVELRQYPQAVHAFDEALKKSPDDAQLRNDADMARKAAATPATR
jgi:cytochrome c-type biogenesis protein CcmH/NrfG